MNILRIYTLDYLRHNKRMACAIMAAILLTTTMLSALCGLDKPAVTQTAAYTHAGADRSLTLTVGGQRGAGYCVTVSDDDTVYLMSAEALAPLLTLAQSGLE